MALIRQLAFIAATSLVGGIAGGLMGAGIGKLAPQYYRTVFRVPGDVDFDAVQMGIGLGSNQGFAVGLIIALALLLAAAWRSRNKASPSLTNKPVWKVAGVLAIIVCSGAAFLIGHIAGNSQVRNLRTTEQIETIERLLAERKIETIRLEMGSGGRFIMTGTIPTEAEIESLRNALSIEFGTNEIEKMIAPIEVSTPPGTGNPS